MLRLAPGHGAGEITLAHAQRHRHQRVGALRQMLAGEADQDAALLHEVGDLRFVRPGDAADIGQHQHRDMLRQQAGDVALGGFGVRPQRPFQVIGIGQQRLFAAARRHDTGAAPHIAGVHQLHGTGAFLAAQRQALHAVAQIQRQGEMAFGAAAALAEMQRRRRQGFAIAAQRRHLDIGRAAIGGADGGHGEAAAVAPRRQQAQRAALRRQQADRALGLQRGKELLRAAILDAVAEPDDGRLVQLPARQCGGGGGAVAGPGHGGEPARQALGFARVQ
jgi:hypothetical protein